MELKRYVIEGHHYYLTPKEDGDYCFYSDVYVHIRELEDECEKWQARAIYWKKRADPKDIGVCAYCGKPFTKFKKRELVYCHETCYEVLQRERKED